MKKKIFINHRIAQAAPDGPVIVVETRKKQQEGNRVDIMEKGKVVASIIFDADADPSRTHLVRAWVETNNRVVIKAR
jgi:hypothetical protein